MDIGIIERNPEDAARTAAPPSGRFVEAGDEKAAVERLEEIRQYLRDRYAERDVVTSTTTPSGQVVDWVPAETQRGVGGVAEPPEPASVTEVRDGVRGARPMPFELAGPGAQKGPPGTVPLVRKDVDALRPVGNLQDWLSKGPRRMNVGPPDAVTARAADDPVHKYAHARQNVICFGTEGTINTWRPYVQWSNEFSLGQLWLVRGEGNLVQTVEVGAQTFKDIYGDWGPHLFIFYTTNNYTVMGNNLGGYNTDVNGWVQVSQTVFPGMNLAESIPGGSQYDLALKVQLHEGNWWVRVGNEWMGYYPSSLYSQTGLQSQADAVDWGGEIVDDVAHHPEATGTWMGSGHFPVEGWQHAAYMRNLSYQSDAAGTMTAFQGFPSVTNPASYNILVDFTGASTWGSNFYWGGPGGI